MTSDLAKAGASTLPKHISARLTPPVTFQAEEAKETKVAKPTDEFKPVSAQSAYEAAKDQVDASRDAYLKTKSKIKTASTVAGIASGGAAGVAIVAKTLENWNGNGNPFMGFALGIPVGMAVSFASKLALKKFFQGESQAQLTSDISKLSTARNAYREELLETINDPAVRAVNDKTWNHLTDNESFFLSSSREGKLLGQELTNLKKFGLARNDAGWIGDLSTKHDNPKPFFSELKNVSESPQTLGLLQEQKPSGDVNNIIEGTSSYEPVRPREEIDTSGTFSVSIPKSAEWMFDR